MFTYPVVLIAYLLIGIIIVAYKIHIANFTKHSRSDITLRFSEEPIGTLLAIISAIIIWPYFLYVTR